MDWFWTGVVVFGIGFVFRIVVRVRHMRELLRGTQTRTELQRRELNARYRQMIFAGLCLEVVGCIITGISLWK